MSPSRRQPPTTPAAPAQGAGPAAAARRGRPYNFRRPDKFNKEQLRTLTVIHEDVARELAARLSVRLRLPVQVEARSTDQMLYQEFVGELESPTQLALCTSPALGGPMLIQLDLPLAFAAVDRQLGGPGTALPKPRPPTRIEAELIKRVLEDVPTALGQGWSQLLALEPLLGETSLQPALLRVAPADHAVAIVGFDISFAGQRGRLQLCYPQEALAPLLEKLSITAWYAEAAARQPRGWRSELARSIGAVEVELVAELDRLSLPLATVAKLRVGDRITLNAYYDEPISVTLPGVARAPARLGRSRDLLAVQLEGPLTKEED